MASIYQDSYDINIFQSFSLNFAYIVHDKKVSWIWYYELTYVN